jgi:hypothetical protein
VEDARKGDFPLKVGVLPEPIMLNMAIRVEFDKKKCSAMEMIMSAVTITTQSIPLCLRGVRQIIVEESNGPFIDWKADLRRDGFRGESASGLCTGQITPARLQ